MKFDTIIIGGGLSGLVCGVYLQKSGRKCAIVSAGQNALNFSSGSFGFLSRLPDGTEVSEPLKVMNSLNGDHPYKKMGPEKVEAYAGKVKSFFADCGIPLHGDDRRNSYMLTPTGEMKPTWLSMEDITMFPSKDTKIGNKALIVNLLGYLDFNAGFIADGLEKRGTACRLADVKLDSIEKLRRNPTEMRAVNIARVMDNESERNKFVSAVKGLVRDEDVVVIPAVFGLKDKTAVAQIRADIGVDTCFAGTMPPSIPGVRAQMQLKSVFDEAGGDFLMGDEAKYPEMKDGKVVSIRTENLGNVKLEADEFVLASGSFFAKGLVSTPNRIYEPVFDLDVEYDNDRNKWYDPQFFNKQNYMGYGVITDSSFKAVKGGKVIDNLFVIGSVLSGMNALYEFCGAGVSIMTAMSVADSILGRQ